MFSRGNVAEKRKAAKKFQDASGVYGEFDVNAVGRLLYRYKAESEYFEAGLLERELERQEREGRLDAERLAREEKETARFYELKKAADDTDRRLTASINQLRNDVFSAIRKQDNLFNELSSVQDNDNTTIAKLNEALMESSNTNIALQSDVNKLNKRTDRQFENLEKLRKDFANLSNLYNVSEEKLKLNESRLSERQDETEKSLTDIQKKLNDNSVMFANEKEGLVREIKAIKENASQDTRREFGILNSKLEALTKKHDAVKTDLLSRLKEQQRLNQTQLEELNAENKARGIRYDKDMEQLRRDLDVTRDEAMQARDALQEQKQRNEKQEKRNRARFKVLYDYQTNVDRQIKIQEKKTTNFAQLKRVREMPDKAKALRNFRRGRYALLDEFV